MNALKVLKNEILAEAKRLGFLLAGMTHPGPPVSYATYKQWLEAGNHADMAYLAAERARTAAIRPASHPA